MRRGDDVFFFTLIDFLLQVFFFGLLLYVVSQAFAPKPLSPQEEKARQELLTKAKVSNLAELTDLLSKMVPMDNLRGTADFISRNGGFEKFKDAHDAAQAAGGVANVRGMQTVIKAKDQELEGLKGEMKAWGTPSCIYETVEGRVKPRTIAKVRVFDDHIELSDPAPEMQALLAQLGVEYSAVKSLGHEQFRQTFKPLVAQKPHCRYFLEVLARPSLLSSMNVVWSAFRT
jgi:hypothetical protein